MSEFGGNSDFSFEGDSTATLTPVSTGSDSTLLDQLAKKLNAAPLQTEAIDFNRMQQLETRLADREQLVSILTQRLEQAADELDRIKRSGGVLAKSSHDIEDAAALLAGQNEVTSKIDHFVAAWEERYEGPALRRMEAGIEELRERLEQATLHGHWPPLNHSSHGFEHSAGAPVQHVGTDDSESAAETRPVRKPLDAPVRLVLISSDDVPDDLDVPLPEPVDESSISNPELRRAISDRDAYIRWLCQRMREITGRLEGWLGELQTESDDTTLHKRVDELEQLIHDQLRVAEIDVSIERAKLSREQARLQEQTARLAHEREKLAKALDSSAEPDDSPLLRRWKKFITNQDS